MWIEPVFIHMIKQSFHAFCRFARWNQTLIRLFHLQVELKQMEDAEDADKAKRRR